MLLADLVTCADAVAATPARTEKIEFLAELLQRADGREAGVVAGLVLTSYCVSVIPLLLIKNY